MARPSMIHRRLPTHTLRPSRVMETNAYPRRAAPDDLVGEFVVVAERADGTRYCLEEAADRAAAEAAKRRYATIEGVTLLVVKAFGERRTSVGGVVLTDADVRKLRALRRRGAKLLPLAAMFKVSVAHVSRVCRGVAR